MGNGAGFGSVDPVIFIQMPLVFGIVKQGLSFPVIVQNCIFIFSCITIFIITLNSKI